MEKQKRQNHLAIGSQWPYQVERPHPFEWNSTEQVIAQTNLLRSTKRRFLHQPNTTANARLRSHAAPARLNVA